MISHWSHRQARWPLRPNKQMTVAISPLNHKQHTRTRHRRRVAPDCGAVIPLWYSPRLCSTTVEEPSAFRRNTAEGGCATLQPAAYRHKGELHPQRWRVAPCDRRSQCPIPLPPYAIVGGSANDIGAGTSRTARRTVLLGPGVPSFFSQRLDATVRRNVRPKSSAVMAVSRPRRGCRCRRGRCAGRRPRRSVR